MNIKTFASSSAGCCYLVESGGEQLLIECGIPLKKIREALDFDLSRIMGCLVSHEHKDHCAALPELLDKTAIRIGAPLSFQESSQLERWRKNYKIYYLTPNDPGKVGKIFTADAIDLTHDVECFGYIIHDGQSILLYASDTGEIPYHISGLTHLMIEANYGLEILMESEQNDALRARIADNHLSIDQAIEFALRHKETLQEVHLLHLSDRHSDEADFLKRMQGAVGVPVYVGRK